MYSVLAIQGRARLGQLETAHGTVQTPVFMNVATSGAIKGGVSALDLKSVKCQIMLCNTYHLHLRPSDEAVAALGGIQGFTGWNGVTLTDSGGFQVFSLAKLRSISEHGVEFSSHIDGNRTFISPESCVTIQANLDSTIAMVLDECVCSTAPRSYVLEACNRTTRWAVRWKEEHARLSDNKRNDRARQMLFCINQGGVYLDIREEHMKELAQMQFDGYAIGGLAVGEPAEVMYDVIAHIEPNMPADKPRYLMGVGTPANILEAVSRGVDMFDCVLPARNARHGYIYTWEGIRNLNNAKYAKDSGPIDKTCGCPTCAHHSRAYIRHLLKAGEVLGMRLAVMHNLYFYNELLERIRSAIESQTFDSFCAAYVEQLSARV